MNVFREAVSRVRSSGRPQGAATSSSFAGPPSNASFSPGSQPPMSASFADTLSAANGGRNASFATASGAPRNSSQRDLPAAAAAATAAASTPAAPGDYRVTVSYNDASGVSGGGGAGGGAGSSDPEAVVYKITLTDKRTNRVDYTADRRWKDCDDALNVIRSMYPKLELPPPPATAKTARSSAVLIAERRKFVQTACQVAFMHKGAGQLKELNNLCGRSESAIAALMHARASGGEDAGRSAQRRLHHVDVQSANSDRASSTSAADRDSVLDRAPRVNFKKTPQPKDLQGSDQDASSRHVHGRGDGRGDVDSRDSNTGHEFASGRQPHRHRRSDVAVPDAAASAPPLARQNTMPPVSPPPSGNPGAATGHQSSAGGLSAPLHASDLTAEQRALLDESFRAVDVDNTGYVARDELEDVLRRLPRPVPHAVMTQVLDDVDKAKIGAFDAKSFRAVVLKLASQNRVTLDEVLRTLRHSKLKELYNAFIAGAHNAPQQSLLRPGAATPPSLGGGGLQPSQSQSQPQQQALSDFDTVELRSLLCVLTRTGLRPLTLDDVERNCPSAQPVPLPYSFSEFEDVLASLLAALPFAELLQALHRHAGDRPGRVAALVTRYASRAKPTVVSQLRDLISRYTGATCSNCAQLATKRNEAERAATSAEKARRAAEAKCEALETAAKESDAKADSIGKLMKAKDDEISALKSALDTIKKQLTDAEQRAFEAEADADLMKDKLENLGIAVQDDATAGAGDLVDSDADDVSSDDFDASAFGAGGVGGHRGGPSITVLHPGVCGANPEVPVVDQPGALTYYLRDDGTMTSVADPSVPLSLDDAAAATTTGAGATGTGASGGGGVGNRSASASFLADPTGMTGPMSTSHVHFQHPFDAAVGAAGASENIRGGGGGGGGGGAYGTLDASVASQALSQAFTPFAATPRHSTSVLPHASGPGSEADIRGASVGGVGGGGVGETSGLSTSIAASIPPPVSTSTLPPYRPVALAIDLYVVDPLIPEFVTCRDSNGRRTVSFVLKYGFIELPWHRSGESGEVTRVRLPGPKSWDPSLVEEMDKVVELPHVEGLEDIRRLNTESSLETADEKWALYNETQRKSQNESGLGAAGFRVQESISGVVDPTSSSGFADAFGAPHGGSAGVDPLHSFSGAHQTFGGDQPSHGDAHRAPFDVEGVGGVGRGLGETFSAAQRSESAVPALPYPNSNSALFRDPLDKTGYGLAATDFTQQLSPSHAHDQTTMSSLDPHPDTTLRGDQTSSMTLSRPFEQAHRQKLNEEAKKKKARQPKSVVVSSSGVERWQRLHVRFHWSTKEFDIVAVGAHDGAGVGGIRPVLPKVPFRDRDAASVQVLDIFPRTADQSVCYANMQFVD